MKKIYFLLLLLPFIAAFTGCNDVDEIVFDHEKQEFPVKDDAILLEVIMPTGSLADDEYYIIGDFNGGEEAIDNPEWRLEKAANSTIKWGIYLVPSSFREGKTLADGFSFYAKRQGEERSVKNEPVVHTLNVQVGSFTNVWVDRWESYFGEVEKNSYSIYVNDQSGWDELALYAWNDDGDVTPAWPGLLPTGTEVINGVTYTVFDMGEERKDVTMNLIFHNNSGQQFDALQGFTLNRDLYLLITGNSYEEVDPDVTPYAGYTVYVDDQTGWDAIALHYWGDGVTGTNWPGIAPAGTEEVNGITYKYFTLPEDLTGKHVSTIFNNNGAGVQFDGPYILIEKDYYFLVTDGTYEEVTP